MQFVRKTYWFLCEQLGMDVRRLLRAPLGFVRYLANLAVFFRTNPYRLRIQPCLHDWWEQAGATNTEYFWQDLIVARMIHQAAPQRHIDVGSRLDGFVAHVASFRELEVFDVRPLHSRIPGVTFVQADMMNADSVPASIADSVSCLHAIEHFGLGRYGDPINPEGSALGVANLAKMLAPNGTLYLSCPAGNDEVFFNAHRALHPATIEGLTKRQGLTLKHCLLFNNATKVFEEVPLPLAANKIAPNQSLALYVLVKSAGAEQPGH
jgi:hypothetical protein